MNGSVTERWLRRLLVVAGIAAFIAVIARSDVRSARSLIAATGPLLLIAAAPYLVQLGFDSLAWRILLGATVARAPRWRRLLTIRLATEAVLMSAPAGGVLGETLKPYLLAREGIATPDAIASVGVKKCLLALGQAAYLTLALVIGYRWLVAHSQQLIGGPGLPVVLGVGIALLLVFAGFLGLTMVGAGYGVRLHRLLMRFPMPRFQTWLSARHAPFAVADDRFMAIGRARARLIAAFASLLLAWLTETVETAVILALLGVDLPFTAVLVMEACAVTLRSAAFFVPAGLGVQDAGYLAFLRAYAIPDAGAAGAAFVIVKRLKEALWVAVGYAILFVLQARAAVSSAGPQTALLAAIERP